jgi:drug/metabolite transporter (DMT)-like permease
VSRRGWVLFALMSVIWGMPYLFIKVADGGVAVPVLVFTRVTVAAALLLPLALRGRQFAGLWRRWRWLLAFAAVEMIVPWALLSNAERRLSSSMTGLLIASVPIITVILARLTGGTERLTAVRWTGLLIGLAGVGVLAGPDAVGGDAWSVAQVLLVAVCYSTGPLIANRKLSELPVLAVNAFCLSFAAIVYAPAAALTWPAAVPSVQVLASLAALAVICTALAFVLFFRLIAEVGPARAMVFTYVNPAVAVALGVVVLGEALTVEIVAAFVLILAGSVLATRPSRPRARVRRGAPPAGEEPAGEEPAGEEPAGEEPPVRSPAPRRPVRLRPASAGSAGVRRPPPGEEP